MTPSNKFTFDFSKIAENFKKVEKRKFLISYLLHCTHNKQWWIAK